MFDRSMPNVSLEMRADITKEIPLWEVPAPYGLRSYREGEGMEWSEIEYTAEEFPNAEDALKRGFNVSFKPDAMLIPGRMFFAVDENDKPVATASAWFYGDIGMLHWVAVHGDHQGKGLARPVISAALRRMQEIGYTKAMLHTQPMSWVAIRLYMEFGFRPVWTDDEHTLAGWKAVFEKLGKEFSREVCVEAE